MGHHFIQRVSLDFCFGSQEKQVQVIDTLRTYFYAEMLPVIEQTLDRKSTAETIRIEYLEIDAGNISFEHLAASLREALENSIDRELNLLKPYVPRANISEPRQNITTTDKRNDEISAFLFFLEHGYLPWFVTTKGIDLTLILEKIIDSNTPAETNGLFQLLSGSDEALTRLIIQFSSGELMNLVEILIGTMEAKYISFIRKWIAWLYAGNWVPANFNNTIFLQQTFKWLLRLYYSVGTNVNFSGRALINFLFAEMPAQGKALHTGDKPLSTFELFIDEFTARVSVYDTNAPDLPVGEQRDVNEAGLFVDIDVKEAEQEAFYAGPEDFYISNQDSYTVVNAGIILLHYYLPAFFANLNLIGKNKFVNRQAQIRAVRLLHFLATGESKTPEHLATLNKLLCGIPVNVPIPGSIKITSGETDACEELLSAIIGHWTQLKSTSINGLRHTFLNRDGVLKKEGEDWILSIEKKGYDILLEDLPWSISTIKLPWNNYIIYTEW